MPELIFDIVYGFDQKTFRCTESHWLTHGKGIMVNESVNEVILSDRMPYFCPSGCVWKHDNLNIEFLKRLQGYYHVSESWRYYVTKEEAMAALSDACLRYATSAS